MNQWIDEFKRRFFLTILISVVGLAVGLIWNGSQTPSWAAPEQNPGFQTLPTRAPTPTSTPDLPDPTPTPISEAAPPSEEEGEDNEDVEPSPTQTSTSAENQAPDEIIPSPSSEPEENTGPGETSPLIPAEPESDQTSAVQPENESAGQPDFTADSQQADLSLSKALDNPRPTVGELIVFTITITNSGPDSATNVVVRDALPAGLKLSAVTTGQGLYSSDRGVWTIERISHNQSLILSLVATVIHAGPGTNIAEIMAVDQPDPDSTPNNRFEREDDQDSASFVASAQASQPDRFKDGSEAAGQAFSSSPVAPSTSKAFLKSLGSLGWLYALLFGIILILSGLFLVNRA